MAEKQSNSIKGGAREGAGRKPGVPNKATQEAREAVKAILDSNLPYLQSWIQSTAEGIFDDLSGKWIVQPNPAKACDIVQNLVEYSVPKLARTEVVGDEKTPSTHGGVLEEIVKQLYSGKITPEQFKKEYVSLIIKQVIAEKTKEICKK